MQPKVIAHSLITGIDRVAKGLGAGLDPSGSGLVAIPANTSCAVIRAELAAVRYRDDGMSPTAGDGQLLAVGSALLQVEVFDKVMLIAAVANQGARLNVTFYG